MIIVKPSLKPQAQDVNLFFSGMNKLFWTPPPRGPMPGLLRALSVKPAPETRNASVSHHIVTRKLLWSAPICNAPLVLVGSRRKNKDRGSRLGASLLFDNAPRDAAVFT